MAEVIVCGQAPSKLGEGLPFQGPSGRRIAILCGVRTREQLMELTTLANLFNHSASLRDLSTQSDSYDSVGDQFDREEGTVIAHRMLDEWYAQEDEYFIVVACGHNVYRCFTGGHGIFYKGKRYKNVEVWCFPHPSGVSSYWNRRGNSIRAANFLRRILKRASEPIDE